MDRDHGIHYRLAASRDRGEIVGLLEAEALPTADLEASGVVLMVAESAQRRFGCIGIQPLGNVGIIRSLAVARDQRGAGIGRALVSHAEALAATGGLHALYLLTENASGFWLSAGYRIVARGETPPEVQQSAEFRSLCPVTAACMRRDLAGSIGIS
jgi:amino-acid N-acetyltransferase